MTIPARTKHPGTWWHDTEIATTQERDGTRKKIRLTIGGNLKVDLTRAHAVELINHIADVMEGPSH